MGFEMKGLNEFRDAFDRLRTRSRPEMSAGIREHLEEVVKPRSDLLVPKLTGDLLATGRVVPGDAEGTWQLRYGNSPVSNPAEVDYAAAVHERDDVTHLPPTEAHFVVRPLKETVGEIAPRIGNKIENLLKEG